MASTLGTVGAEGRHHVGCLSYGMPQKAADQNLNAFRGQPLFPLQACYRKTKQDFQKDSRSSRRQRAAKAIVFLPVA